MERKRRRVKRGDSFTVHEDMLDFYKGYGRGGPSMEEIGRRRNQKLKEGDAFWNTDHDEEMKETARNNTDNAVCKGWKFPRRKR